MAYRCDITSKGKLFGHHVSHSQRKTQKIFKPNLQTKTLIINGQKVRLKLAASTIRTLKKYQNELASYQPKDSKKDSPKSQKSAAL